MTLKDTLDQTDLTDIYRTFQHNADILIKCTSSGQIMHSEIIIIWPLSVYANKLDPVDEMDIFLEKYNPPKLNQEESENLNRLVIDEIVVIKKTPSKQKPRYGWLQRGVLSIIQRITNTYIPSNYSKKSKRRNTFKLLL